LIRQQQNFLKWDAAELKQAVEMEHWIRHVQTARSVAFDDKIRAE